MKTETWYTLVYTAVWPFMNLVHPVKAIGRENIPEGGCMICGNHTSAADPLMLVYAVTREKCQVRPMAKVELTRLPVVGFLLRKAGVFGVDRGSADVGAIRTAMKYLRGGEKVLVYPEGHRVRKSRGDVRDPKSGAAMLAVRCGVPILPVYIPEKKNLFRPTPVVFGEPYFPKTETKKGTPEEYEAITADLMHRIDALEEKIK